MSALVTESILTNMEKSDFLFGFFHLCYRPYPCCYVTRSVHRRRAAVTRGACRRAASSLVPRAPTGSVAFGTTELTSPGITNIAY